MEALRQYLKKFARGRSLNAALLSIILWSFYIGLWTSLTIKFLRSGDQGDLVLGLVNATVGVLNLFAGVYSLREVVRRLIAESRNAL